MYCRILVAYNGSPGADRALATALTLARATQAEICAISVEGQLPQYAAAAVPEPEQASRAYFAPLQERARHMARERGVDLHLSVLPGTPAEVIVEFARSGRYDLIVMGHKGHSRLHNYFIGATTDRVSHLAPCSVLIVP